MELSSILTVSRVVQPCAAHAHKKIEQDISAKTDIHANKYILQYYVIAACR